MMDSSVTETPQLGRQSVGEYVYEQYEIRKPTAYQSDQHMGEQNGVSHGSSKVQHDVGYFGDLKRSYDALFIIAPSSSS